MEPHNYGTMETRMDCTFPVPGARSLQFSPPCGLVPGSESGMAQKWSTWQLCVPRYLGTSSSTKNILCTYPNSPVPLENAERCNSQQTALVSGKSILCDAAASREPSEELVDKATRSSLRLLHQTHSATALNAPAALAPTRPRLPPSTPLARTRLPASLSASFATGETTAHCASNTTSRPQRPHSM